MVCFSISAPALSRGGSGVVDPVPDASSTLISCWARGTRPRDPLPHLRDRRLHRLYHDHHLIRSAEAALRDAETRAYARRLALPLYLSGMIKDPAGPCNCVIPRFAGATFNCDGRTACARRGRPCCCCRWPAAACASVRYSARGVVRGMVASSSPRPWCTSTTPFAAERCGIGALALFARSLRAWQWLGMV